MEIGSTLSALVDISIELSKEKETTKLLENILLTAKKLSNSDGGTIYGVVDQKELKFDTLFNDTLDMYMGGSSDKEIPFPHIPIYVDGEVNMNALVARSAGLQEVINIEDVYQVTEYDMSGAKKMDAQTGYHTHSVLTIPMTNHEGELNGVLQLINAQKDGKVIAFTKDVEKSIQALASLAAVAMTNRELIDDMEELFQAFTQLIAKAIDEKSPYTGGHCRRVPELTMMIAEAVNKNDKGVFADFSMNETEMAELSLAGWLHDCGKIGTPEYVMDKAKKLETIFDRIALVENRFELAKRDAEMAYYKALADCSDDKQEKQLHAQMTEKLNKLDEDYEFIRVANTGGEFMSKEAQQRVEDIGQSCYVSINGKQVPLLNEEEIYNLQTARGTLNNEEREIINNHMNLTIDMLESLPFPKHLCNVPELAGGHHEKMDGTGYPKGLTREQMSIPARMMALADIFEALTSTDRPYKGIKMVSECVDIMGKMSLGQHIDPDLFNIFVDQKVYMTYADKFLDKSQVDEIDVDKIPGYTPL